MRFPHPPGVKCGSELDAIRTLKHVWGVLQLKFDNNVFSDHRSWRKARQELLWHISFYFGVSVFLWGDWQFSPCLCSGVFMMQDVSLGTFPVLCVVFGAGGGFICSVPFSRAVGALAGSGL